MKQTIKILAVGGRVNGTKVSKKNGQAYPYDFVNFSVLYENTNPWFAGKEIGEIIGIDTAVIGNRIINPGDILEVEMWTQNYRTKVGAIYG